MIRPIIQAPDARLHIVARPIIDINICKEVVKDLHDTFFDNEDKCIGLAATQLDLHWSVIIVDTSPFRTETYMMVNPIIVKQSEDLQLVRDGCASVSFGKKFANTKRPKRIVVEWYDPDTWVKKRQKFNGLIAACIHHEIDHLHGVLFIDRIVAVDLARGENNGH